MTLTYPRSDPRYRRLYATIELRRRGYRKAGEREERVPGKWIKVLIYRKRVWQRGITHDTLVSIYPDGSTKESHSISPELKG